MNDRCDGRYVGPTDSPSNDTVVDGAVEEPPAGTCISVPGVPNLRDVGGWRTSTGGVVRRRMLYRGTELCDLASDGRAAIARLGLRSVYDLRTEAERRARPDTVPPGASYVVADVLADSPTLAPGRIVAVFAHPDEARKLLGDGKGRAILEQAYRELVSLPSARDAYHRLFSDLAGGACLPALFHCRTGKDRTGWAAAALLTLLGVPDADVMADYLATNAALLPLERQKLDAFAASGGDKELLRQMLTVEPAYLDAAVREMKGEFGTIDRYFADGLGIDEVSQASLREVFAGSGPP